MKTKTKTQSKSAMRPTDPAKEMAWVVIVASGDDKPTVEWVESEAYANKIAEQTLADAKEEEWGPTDVYVLQSIRQGSANRSEDV